MSEAQNRAPWFILGRDQVVLYALCAALLALVAARQVGLNSHGGGVEVRRSVADMGYRVNINRADVEELDLLPGIGPRLAARIADERRKRGPFESVSALGRVSGISCKRVEALRDLITTEPLETGGESLP